MIAILCNLFPKVEPIPNSFYEASITLIPKQDADIKETNTISQYLS